MIKLGGEFYRADGLTLAERLLGKTLVHRTEAGEMRGIITETEAYMGVCDRASHAYGGRRTERTESMYLDGGHAYVYLIYGIYNCMNITANVADVPEAVLIRAIYPTVGRDLFLRNYRLRGRRRNLPGSADAMSNADVYKLTNGPGKLCVSMDIDRRHDKISMMGDELFLIDEGYTPRKIIRASRIGIDYAGEDRNNPWRFTVSDRGGVPELVRCGNHG